MAAKPKLPVQRLGVKSVTLGSDERSGGNNSQTILERFYKDGVFWMNWLTLQMREIAKLREMIRAATKDKTKEKI